MLIHKDSPWMPSFSKSHTKYMARELHIGHLYPLLTGNLILPFNKSYWYLCNYQDDTQGSEIYQLTKKIRRFGGKSYIFARPEQCYGVDRNGFIIENNKKIHPNSNWIKNEWSVAIQNQEIFDPGLIYLDTTSFADKLPAATALKQTLSYCKKNTLVIANVMMNNSRAGNGENLFDPNALVDNFLCDQHPQTFASWNISPYDEKVNLFHSYEYQTSKTLMRSYIFFKGTLPKTNVFMKKFSEFENWCSFYTKELSTEK